MAAQLSLLIASVLTKPDIVQRKVSALVGAVVADAASQHLQWIYNQVTYRDLSQDGDRSGLGLSAETRVTKNNFTSHIVIRQGPPFWRSCF